MSRGLVKGERETCQRPWWEKSRLGRRYNRSKVQWQGSVRLFKNKETRLLDPTCRWALFVFLKLIFFLKQTLLGTKDEVFQ